MVVQRLGSGGWNEETELRSETTISRAGTTTFSTWLGFAEVLKKQDGTLMLEKAHCLYQTPSRRMQNWTDSTVWTLKISTSWTDIIQAWMSIGRAVLSENNREWNLFPVWSESLGKGRWIMHGQVQETWSNQWGISRKRTRMVFPELSKITFRHLETGRKSILNTYGNHT